MALIFLAYSNSINAPLPTLSEEDEKVYNAYLARRKEDQLVIHRESFATRSKICKQLQAFKNELSVFMFSGHADRDSLVLDDKTVDSEGIIQLLGLCPNLKLVILNGCSTYEQVDQLLALDTEPVVIATSAPVEDYAATQFGISFFQVFFEQYTTIEQAFEVGVAVARTRTQQKIELATNRSLGKKVQPANEKEKLWGLHFPQGHDFKLQWSIPIQYTAGDDYKGNDDFVNELIKEVAPFSQRIKTLYDRDLEGQEISLLLKRRTILEILPHPISQHLRKLLVEQDDFSGLVFYDKPGQERLRQLITTYRSIVELPAFILLAQLWDSLHEQEQLNLNRQQENLLKEYLQTSTSARIQRFLFPLIKVLIGVLVQNKIEIFVPELEALEEDLAKGSGLFNACLFFENIDNVKSLEDQKAQAYCSVGEKKLAQVIGKFGFLSNYTLVSVKNINVKKNRYILRPEFHHRLVELIQRFVGLEPTFLTSGEIIDDSSIHLQKIVGQKKYFLNLSPFIIDMHAFDDAAQEAKLYYFEGYMKVVDACSFRHVYKPKDNLLLLKSEMLPKRDKHWQLRIFKHQFDAFSRLLFNQPLNGL